MKNLKWHLVLSFIIFLLPPSWGQTIITIAGIDIEGYNGDNIAAITAELSSPHAIILDSAGNFYISDFSNNRIRKVSTLGIVTTFVGTGAPGFNGDGNPATATKIYNPWGMAFVSRGFFYFSQFGNNCIR